MDQFQRTGDRHQSRRGLPNRFCRGNGQDRADSFSSSHETVPHAFVECGGRRCGAGHDEIEEPIHVVTLLFEVALDVHGVNYVCRERRWTGAERNKWPGGCQTVGRERPGPLLARRTAEWLEPDDLLCSRNARPRKALVGRAQWKINQPTSLEKKRSSLGGEYVYRSLRAAKGSLGHSLKRGIGNVELLVGHAQWEVT